MKKLLKITLALMMALCLQLTSFNSVHALNKYDRSLYTDTAASPAQSSLSALHLQSLSVHPEACPHFHWKTL